MNATKIAQNEDFISMSMAEAFGFISEKTGISVKSLQKQFPENYELQQSVAKIVANSAKSLSDML